MKKRYDEPKSPYQRVLASDHADEILKEKLRQQFEELNPVELHRKINTLQEKLWDSVRRNGAQPMGVAL